MVSAEQTKDWTKVSDEELLHQFKYFSYMSGVEHFRANYDQYEECRKVISDLRHELRRRLASNRP